MSGIPIIYISTPQYAIDFIASLSKNDKDRFVLFFDDLSTATGNQSTIDLLANVLPHTIISSATVPRSTALEEIFVEKYPNAKIKEFTATDAYTSHVYNVLDFEPHLVATTKASFFRTGSFVLTSNPQQIGLCMHKQLTSLLEKSDVMDKIHGSPLDLWNHTSLIWINSREHYRACGTVRGSAFVDFRETRRIHQHERDQRELAYGYLVVKSNGTGEQCAKEIIANLNNKKFLFYVTDIACGENSPFVGFDLSENISDILICDDYAEKISDAELVQLAGRTGRNGNTGNIFASEKTLARLKNFSRTNSEYVEPFSGLAQMTNLQSPIKQVFHKRLTIIGATRKDHGDKCLERIVFPQMDDDDFTSHFKISGVEQFTDLENFSCETPLQNVVVEPEIQSVKKQVDERMLVSVDAIDDWETETQKKITQEEKQKAREEKKKSIASRQNKRIQ
jgi:hypothetical protein